MAATQKNFKWYRYVDDDARNWGLRVDSTHGDNAAFGLAAFNAADPPFGRQTTRHAPRKVIYLDPTTFRTVTIPVGTAAAMAAAPATLDIIVPGEVAAVTYDLAQRVGERLQIPRTSRNAPDHA